MSFHHSELIKLVRAPEIERVLESEIMKRERDIDSERHRKRVRDGEEKITGGTGSKNKKKEKM